ncbi:MAG: Cysteine desulfuration protein SufE [Verrucomicrobiota bacterium]|jgi:cysteine desulfuration protein SufE
MPLTRRLQQVIEDLAAVDDPQERLALVIDRAKRIPPLAPAERVDVNRVAGCVSVVWIIPVMRGGVCEFRSDAESPVVRGLLALLCDYYSGVPPGTIVASETDPLEQTGLARNLSPTRRNGLASARTAIRAFATRNLSAPPATAARPVS